MSSAYANSDGIVNRKGIVLLTRLGINLPFESTIEERLLRVLDMDLRVLLVKRAETIKVYSVDGSFHEYTSDFEVTLGNDQVYSLECKPMALLHDILADDLPKWTARALLLQQQHKLLHIVTEEDLPDSLVQWSLSYGPFFNTKPTPEIAQNARAFLLERGFLPLSSLRQHLKVITQKSLPEIDGTLYGMIARQELMVDSTNLPPDCIIDLPDQGIEPPQTPLGQSIHAWIAKLPHAVKSKPTIDLVLSPAQLLEAKFLATPRGERALKLFSHYPNPNVTLSVQTANELAKKLETTDRTIYRFRQSLIDAGAPGITFTDLVPFLTSFTQRKPKRQIDSSVATILEDLILKNYFVPVGTLSRARTIGDLHEMVRTKCLDQDLSPPSYNTVKRHVEMIAKRDPIKAAKMRDGHEKAASLEARQGTLDIRRYGELISIDCTPCDIRFLKSGIEIDLRINGRGKNQRKEATTRGNFVTVTDVSTGQVLRSVIFEGGIGGAAILEVIRDVILRNETVFKEAGVVTIPQAYGLPQRIRMDSGSEFTNKQVARVLAHLGIERLPRNAYTKHFGGVEERTIGVLSHAHHVLPGTTMNTIEKRGEYNSQSHAILTFQDLNAFHQRMVERQNNLPAPLQEFTRYQHAQHLINIGLTSWRPLSESQLKFVQNRMHPEVERSTITEGISMFGLKYQSDVLRPLIIRKADLKITYNPDDISVIHALHPDTGEMIRLKPRLPGGLKAPISEKEFAEYKRRVAQIKRQAKDKVATPQQIAQDIMVERQTRIEESRKISKGKKKATFVDVLSDEFIDDGKETIKAAKLVFIDNPVKR
ncbi:MAG: hypothetical protein RLZZ156_57 [Deinococcota bacterium]|jgi:hypothetical protein